MMLGLRAKLRVTLHLTMYVSFRQRLAIMPLPSKMTVHAARFAHNITSDRALLVFVSDRFLSQALTFGGRPANRIPGEDLELYSQGILQMVHARTVDTFEVYLISCVDEALRLNPALLSDKAEVMWEAVRDAQRLSTLRKAEATRLIRKKVDELGHSGFRKLVDWYKNNGVELRMAKRQRRSIEEWIAARNVVVHNHGIVNQRYRELIAGTDLQAGDVRRFIRNELAEMHETLAQLVFSWDAAIAAGLSLRTRSIKGWGLRLVTLPPEDWMES